MLFRSNTPITPDGYTRVLIGKGYVDALEYAIDRYGSETCEIISVEAEGQEIFQDLGFFDSIPKWKEKIPLVEEI